MPRKLIEDVPFQIRSESRKEDKDSENQRSNRDEKNFWQDGERKCVECLKGEVVPILKELQ